MEELSLVEGWREEPRLGGKRGFALKQAVAVVGEKTGRQGLPQEGRRLMLAT
jgi:hypothetical protein